MTFIITVESFQPWHHQQQRQQQQRHSNRACNENRAFPLFLSSQWSDDMDDDKERDKKYTKLTSPAPPTAADDVVVGNGSFSTRLDDYDDDDSVGGKTKQKSFNPFDYKATRSDAGLSYSSTQISLRKTRMQSLVNDLLNVVTDPAQVRALLLQYQDFLLEPLEDTNAVLDPDSIYTPNMTRTQRYQAYRSSMQQRIAAAKHPAVKSALTAMRDFVVSFE